MKVRLFARFREILGEFIDIEANISVKELREFIRKRLSEKGYESDIPIIVAVNGSYVKDDYVITEHDEVVVFPPVSGG